MKLILLFIMTALISVSAHAEHVCAAPKGESFSPEHCATCDGEVSSFDVLNFIPDEVDEHIEENYENNLGNNNEAIEN